MYVRIWAAVLASLDAQGIFVMKSQVEKTKKTYDVIENMCSHYYANNR